ncbi:uncharacterized protein PITG_12554 [Phytophthora infestans T30-4]|uniref:Uncharacterized protein n=1 Tax=Phytophthora infestans (strain T30-4) TaxID=403677 RepID=D0NKT8_PHYIT|nr:uncharacterized protein PITG_12554 [Phytophthora infestans T30-4]EEY60224.1 conserved hypothetical protein [Phytophthora infestans T30-4]|eukprot:XP_002900431.1 conserved hypothetical protein [Phytophthora infestans T30-4]
MAPLPTLLAFCNFLENLLHTSSLALMRRMITDFYAGNEHTLQDFMRLGATVISVMPVKRTSPRKLKEAARLLAEQKKENEVDINGQRQTQMGTPTSPPCVFRYLSARVATRNVLWLRDIFHEYCHGEAALLHEFVRRGDQAISVIPVDIQALSMVPLPPPPLSVDPTLKAVVRASIMDALERLEAKEPWKEVFNPDKLSLPFSRVRYPQLAAALQTFWQKNARAVWERKFWAPLSRSRNLDLHNQRRCRQLKAGTFFERKVILPIYNELGAFFFVEMDQRPKPQSGWYYFEQAVDLFTLAQRYGLHACLQYLESEAFKRFPVGPGKNRNFYGRMNGKSRSMWSSVESLRSVLDEIVAIKTKTKDRCDSDELLPR